MRLFVAVFPPAAVVQRLAGAARAVASGLSPKAVAWTQPEQIHLTLNFLGSVDQGGVAEIERAMDGACRRGERHRLQARSLGCFPSPARARIIWAGLGGALAALEGLKQALDENLARIGYAPDPRPFHPHLTLGRVKLWTGRDRRHLTEALPQWRDVEFGPWTWSASILWKAGFRPRGRVTLDCNRSRWRALWVASRNRNPIRAGYLLMASNWFSISGHSGTAGIFLFAPGSLLGHSASMLNYTEPSYVRTYETESC
jgi:2'-5' RNA ligase